MISFAVEKKWIKGRVTHLQSSRCRYYNCHVNGCKKVFRSVALLSPLEFLTDFEHEDISPFFTEHVEGEIHDHDAVDLVSRGILRFISINSLSIHQIYLTIDYLFDFILIEIQYRFVSNKKKRILLMPIYYLN